MLEINNLKKSFEDKLALNNINIKVDDGKIYGIVGINGSGKSTLLRILSGVYKQDSGDVLYDGKDVYENEEVKRNIFFLSDDPFYDNSSTINSLYELYSTFYDVHKDEYYHYIKLFKLPFAKPIHSFSKGMKRQTFIALALAIRPKYLLLDEAFDGLDPLSKRIFKDAIKSIVKNFNITCLVSSHSLRELGDICDDYFMIDNGSVNSLSTNHHCYQVVFKEKVIEDDIKFEYESIEINGSVVKIITKDTLDAFSKKIKDLNPIIVEEIKVDFEKVFILEAKGGNK